MRRLLRCLPLLFLGFTGAGFRPYQGEPKPFSKTPSGIEYRIYHKVNGRYALRPATSPAAASQTGKVLSAHLQYRNGKDSTVFNSRRQLGMPVQIPMAELKVRGGVEEALTMLQPGDSAVFRFQADSVFARSFRQPVPPPIRQGGNVLLLLVKANQFLTPEEARAEQQRMVELARQKEAAESAQRLAKDIAAIQAYATRNKLTLQKTPGGTHYVITKRGTGNTPTPGQTVSVLYTGSLLDGKVFDSSEKNGGRPIDFPIGRNMVIQGWDQAIPLLPNGSKAILLIPSALAYGSRGAGADIPPNAILRFDVELVAVK
ncbi:FKBP-type peptidyl-prolyl cis-trans isomerase [Hymenobacter psychrotolerans]|uniref:Peptidyl-prolyl cis-trans isomerase n=1 Tax=Hymenobacter psychrotolerans DSM 18569 TaxID=1121959 RepID=A0A1M6YP40_9BACT|nr:FKBP-type peptidyl-prolyl cis-trans isomerase [Hymenobacter psychrotolerans]SHL19842.1 FKBP-type peptidyl-prolyl cis-trans isomerase [Hymenobacter psychrotolerans DSM 18569]